MNSIILQLAAKYLRFLFLTFAILALLQGHNHPGGGFIGGLLAALSTVYYSLAFNSREAKKRLKVKPEYFMGIGLFCIFCSLLPSLLLKQSLMKGQWISYHTTLLGELKFGTPLLFDFGVFLTVIGVTILFLFTLSNEK